MIFSRSLAVGDKREMVYRRSLGGDLCLVWE